MYGCSCAQPAPIRRRARWLLVCRELGLLAGEIGRVHRASGELDRARAIETDLHEELEQIRARIGAEQPETGELDAETEAARRAWEPLGPATARHRSGRPAATTSTRSSG